MPGEPGGWLWLAMDVIFVAVLGVALAYGILRWRAREPGHVRRSDAATERLYHESEAEVDREAAARRWG